MTEPTTTYRYADGTEHVVPVTIGGLDAVMPANASERTAPRRTVTVERKLLVDLLVAKQKWDAADGSLEAHNAWESFEFHLTELGQVIA